MQYHFFYDESEHSREIGFETVMANNFYDTFVAVIVGWRGDYQSSIEAKYREFENKYEYRKSKGELKSHTIKNAQLKYGFASLSKDNVKFIDDFLSLFTENIYLYFSSISKVEYIVSQLFQDYHNSFFADMDAFKYSITKALVINRPRELIYYIYHEPNSIISALKDFFKKKIEIDRKNPELKALEIKAFSHILLLLDDIQVPLELKWDYHPSFDYFQLFLCEQSIKDYCLTIDREGEHHTTAYAAKEIGLKNVDELDSTEHFAIRMADMIAGLISKLMKSICQATQPADPNDVQKTILPIEWFKLNAEQLQLYKKFHYVICELNKSCYKAYAGIYSDDLISLVSLLEFMNHFSSVKETQKNISMQGEYFNSYLCQSLSDYYSRMRNKLPIDPIDKTETEYYFNQRGAKVYYDPLKQPELTINDGSIRYQVLSVGFDRNNVPLITIEENKQPVCYRLPNQLLDWTKTAVAVANKGDNVFPSDVVFTKKKEKYYADIL